LQRPWVISNNYKVQASQRNSTLFPSKNYLLTPNKITHIVSLCRINLIADAKPVQLKDVIGDEKTAKQVHNAAKRPLSKKRSAATGDADANADPSPQKKPKKSHRSALDRPNDDDDPATTLEASLALPPLEMDEQRLAATTLVCNRAPVVLAFGVALLRYTRPAQPLSSRLSLAQAAVSLNSRSKAVSLGLEKGKSADEEGSACPAVHFVSSVTFCAVTRRAGGVDAIAAGAGLIVCSSAIAGCATVDVAVVPDGTAIV